MKLKIALFVALTLVPGLLFSVSVKAQGVVVPIICDIRPCRPRPIPRTVPLPNALPVKSINIDTKIDGQVARTHVEQIFRNDTPYTLEGAYFFPIPETASIVEFAIWEDGKRLVGEVRSREEARRIYDEIVRRQRDPGLLEYAGKDLFQASIFPIPPHSDKKLELIYSQVLKAESGTASFRYPLGTGRNVRSRPQQVSQTPAVPQSFGTVSGKIELKAKQPLRNIYSPSHSIEVKRTSETSAFITFETKNNNNDFQLFYGLSGEDFGLSLITHREPGRDGYFLLMLSPKDEVADRELVSKDIVFVLDTSGSMADEGKMEKARAALLFGVRTLKNGDRFNVIGFAGEERLMERGLIAADVAGKRRAEEFIQRLSPTGGTNINDALVAAAKQFERSDRPKMLVFMTDGLPTVGERSVEGILKNFKAVESKGVRVFPFGFGYDVNTALLDRLGSDNAGISDYVQPKEDLELKVSAFFSRVSSPVLADVEIDLGAADTEFVYPRKPGDLFRGMQIAMIGRYKNTSDLRNLTVALRGKDQREARTFNFRGLELPFRNDENDFLPRLWASRRVGHLIEQIRLNGETKELRDEVTDLGTRFGLVTPYTSYLATDGTVVNAGDAATRQRIMRAASPKMAERSGADAVQMSVQQNSMIRNTQIVEEKAKDARERILVDDTATSQFFAGKNFSLQNGVWVDSEFAGRPGLRETTVEFGGEEYFKLAAAVPGLARYFSLGEQVIVVWNGQVYKVERKR